MRIALAPLAAVTLAGCAASAPPLPASDAVALAGPACFRARDIENHTVGDDRTLYLRVRGEGTYRLGMSGACLAGARSSDPIITREPPGSNYVCSPIDLDLSIVPASVGPESPCIVRSIALMTPAEVEALPPRLRP